MIAGPSKAKDPAPKAAKKANKTTTPLDTNSDDFEVLGSSQLSYNLLVREDHESGEVMVRLQPKHKRIPKKKCVVAQPHQKPKNAGKGRVTSYAMNRNPKAYNEHRYARASRMVMGRINGYEIPMLIDCGSEICIISEDITKNLGLGWKEVEWKMVMADGNRSDLNKVTESVPIEVHGVTLSVPVFLAHTRSEQVILGRPWEAHAHKCERNLDDGSCEITITAANGTKQVTFVATYSGDKRDRFATSGNAPT